MTASSYEIAQLIDHAILRPDVTREELTAELEKAHRLNVFSVCVRPADVAYAVQHLNLLNSEVKVGTVIGFPHGSQSHQAKLTEIREAARDGASEVDIVVDISKAKDAAVKNDVARILESELSEQVATAIKEGGMLTKLILETAYLTPEEVRMTSKIGDKAGFDFLKTSTGFAHEGATIFNLLIMKGESSPGTQLKASGGVGSLKTLLEMREIGVTRFGTSKTETILNQLEQNNLEEVEDDGVY